MCSQKIVYFYEEIEIAVLYFRFVSRFYLPRSNMYLVHDLSKQYARVDTANAKRMTRIRERARLAPETSYFGTIFTPILHRESDFASLHGRAAEFNIVALITFD